VRDPLIVVATAFEAVERVRRALRDEFALIRCATVEEAVRAIARASADGRRVAGAILEPRDARGTPTASLVRRVDEHVPVFALMRRAAPWCAATVALLEARPTHVLIAEELDVGSVVGALSTRMRRAAFVSATWGSLEPDVPVGLRPLVRIALGRADAPLSVQGIADALGLHRKTVWSRCRRHGLGSVQALMTWCRLLAVEHALRTCTRPVDAIAEELAFASPTALRNAVRRYLRTTPSALRAGGAQGRVSEEFRAWMRGLRAPPEEGLGDVA
jgi:AraC-like DNA-binding protein